MRSRALRSGSPSGAGPASFSAQYAFTVALTSAGPPV
jgi:hypothetical protein